MTKDADFKEFRLLKGTPRKLIKLNTGNSSTKQLLFLFEKNWEVLLQVIEQDAFLIESDLYNFFLVIDE